MTAQEAKQRIMEEMSRLSPQEREAVISALDSEGLFHTSAQWLCDTKSHATPSAV